MTPALAPRRPLLEERALPQRLAFDEVYRAHAATVAKWAARLGGPRVDYEDVVQEVFLKVQRELPGFRGTGKLTTWLYRMTLNEVRHRLRKDRLRRWVAGLAPEIAGGLPSPERSAPDTIEHRQAMARLYAALYALSPKFREVLVLFEMEERSGEEVAELMGARVETVWVWLHRARAQLARRLERPAEGDA